MNFCFICQLVPKEVELADKRVSNAAQLYQEKFIEFTAPELVISIVPVFFTAELQQKINGRIVLIHCWKDVFGKKLGKVVKLAGDTFTVIKMLRRRKEIKDIWFYNLNFSTLLIAFLAKLLLRRKLFVLLADYSPSKTPGQKIIHNQLSKFAGAITLNSNIRIIKNSTTLPGLIRDREIISPKENLLLNKNILLSGSLGVTTGLLFALDFFSKCCEYNLFITGRPFRLTEKELEDIIGGFNSENIRYLGQLCYEDYLKVLDSCSVTLSLRDASDPDHDYNFPSKILEYLSRNKIVISTKSYSDISKDLLFITKSDEKDLAKVLERIYTMLPQEIFALKQMIYDEVRSKFSKNALVSSINYVSNGY